MDYQAFIETLSPDVVDRLRRGVETGRWPDGRELTPQQKEHSLQAVIAWERLHLPAEERVGYIDRGGKAESGDEQQMRWVEDSRGEES